MRQFSHGKPLRHVSPSFIGLIALMVLSGIVMYQDLPFSNSIAPFIFILSGWMISLCLHEFGHAFVAYHGGDTNIPQTGYLSLDPLSYTHPIYSIAIPILFIALGFFALPGGAVYIRYGQLRSRQWQSATYAAGPLMTFFCLCIVSAPFALGWHEYGGTPIFWAANAALAGYLALAIIWNLIPIPGLDGWGIINPYMPIHIQMAARQWSDHGPFLLIAIAMLFRPFGIFIVTCAMYFLEFLEVPSFLSIVGMSKVTIKSLFSS